jgi:hypothetical protein
MRGWEGQPRKLVEYEHWQENKPGLRSPDCGLKFGGAENNLLAIRLQRPNTLFSVARTSSTSNSMCLVL